MSEVKQNNSAKWIWLSVAALASIMVVLVAQAISGFVAGVNALGDAAAGTAESIFPLRKNN
jgi:hypothetical protein